MFRMTRAERQRLLHEQRLKDKAEREEQANALQARLTQERLRVQRELTGSIWGKAKHFPRLRSQTKLSEWVPPADLYEPGKPNTVDEFGFVPRIGVQPKRSTQSDVFVTAWKAGEYLPTLLQTIANNTLLPRCVWIGVDACQETLDALREHLSVTSYGFPIQVFWSPVNQGTYVLKNHLVDLSDSLNVFVLDADDFISPNYFEVLEACLDQHPDSVWAAYNWHRFKQGPLRPDGTRSVSEARTGFYGCADNCFRRSLWKQVGYYLDTRTSGDYEWLHRANKLGIRVRAHDHVTKFYRQHPEQLTIRIPTRKNSVLYGLPYDTQRSYAMDIAAQNTVPRPEKRHIELQKVLPL